jgi:hypothetical protein
MITTEVESNCPIVVRGRMIYQWTVSSNVQVDDTLADVPHENEFINFLHIAYFWIRKHISGRSTSEALVKQKEGVE